MYDGASLRPDITPTGIVAHPAPTLAPSLWRRAVGLAGRLAARTATFFGGLVAGVLVTAAAAEFVAEEIAVDLAMGIAIAVWFTAGRAWLRLRNWPRLLIVFAIVAGVWLFVLSPLYGRLMNLNQ